MRFFSARNGIVSAHRGNPRINPQNFGGKNNDLVHPHYYSRAVQILESYRNVGFVGAWVKYFGEGQGNFIGWNTEPPYILFHNCMNTASMVARKRVFLARGMNSTKMKVGMEDYESMIRMVSAGFGGVVIPELLFEYRVRADSMMRSFNRKNDIYCYEMIAELNADFLKKHALAVINLLNANGPGYSHDNPLVAVEHK